MMSLVLDNSVSMSWCFEDEQSPYPEAVLESLSNSDAHVPAIWPLEVLNALLVAERRRRIPTAKTTSFVRLLALLPIHVTHDSFLDPTARILEIGRSFDLSSYDAAYLELAERLRLPLASQDNRMVTAARQLGVAIWQP